jgi:exosortase K
MRTWFNNNFPAEQKHTVIVTALILILCLPFGEFFDEFWWFYFCMPSARFCSLFLGSDCIPTANGYMLTNESLAIHITKACSGASFFILLCALIISVTIKSIRMNDVVKLCWILPLAYIVTLLANSSRILAGWITGRWARAFLPEDLWGGVHLGTGVVIFLTFLICTYSLLIWKANNGLERIKTFNS